MSDMQNQELEIHHKSYKLSWTAYIRPILFLGLVGFAFFMLATIEPETLRSSKPGGEDWTIIHPYLSGVGWVMFGFTVLRLIYIIADARAVRLYTDSDGVWLYSGILPWNKGRHGVRWEDMDSASYRLGLIRWLFNSHTVIITHKFTKDREVSMPHISRGRDAAQHINAMYKIHCLKQ